MNTDPMRPFRKPATYLVAMVLTAAWYWGMTLCPFPAEVLQGKSMDVPRNAVGNTCMFFAVSFFSILGYFYYSFKTPSLRMRTLVGFLWAPVTCVIYILLIREMQPRTGLLSGFAGRSTSGNFEALRSFGVMIAFVPVFFFISSWFVIIVLLPTTIFTTDRISHVFGLTAGVLKRERSSLAP